VIGAGSANLATETGGTRNEHVTGEAEWNAELTCSGIGSGAHGRRPAAGKQSRSTGGHMICCLVPVQLACTTAVDRLSVNVKLKASIF
jgi:hypothetical protein